MKNPVIIDHRAALHLGDCLAAHRAGRLATCDHVITDPPYENHMHKAKAGARGIRTDGHASPAPVTFASIEEIRDEAAQMFAGLAQGWVLAFCTPEGVAPWRDTIEAAGLRYKRACIWVKPDAAPQFNGQGPAMGAECFVAAWAGDGVSRWNGGGRSNVFTYPIRSPTRDGRHETEKPLALMMDIVASFTDPGDTVLDPFMGSGTTGVACMRLGRMFVGVEKDPRFFKIAESRIRAAAAQGDFFIPALPAKQAGLPIERQKRSKKNGTRPPAPAA